MSDQRLLIELAVRIADGEPIEWQRQRDLLGGEDAGIIDRLVLLESLRRTLEHQETGRDELRPPACWGHLEIR